MNPGLYPDYSSTQQGLNMIPIQWTSGSTGAVPALSAFKYRQGVTSVTRDGTGLYTIVLPAACKGVFGLIDNIVQASFSTTGAVRAVIIANNLTVTGTHSIQIKTVTAADAAVDPASGDVIMLTLLCQWNCPR